MFSVEGFFVSSLLGFLVGCLFVSVRVLLLLEEVFLFSSFLLEEDSTLLLFSLEDVLFLVDSFTDSFVDSITVSNLVSFLIEDSLFSPDSFTGSFVGLFVVSDFASFLLETSSIFLSVVSAVSSLSESSLLAVS